MATEFKLPVLGEGADSGTLVKILIAVGDTITSGQPILEVEAGKSVVEVPSDVAGTVQEITVQEGATINPGDTILKVGEAAGAASADTKPAEAPVEAKSVKVEVPVAETPKAPEPATPAPAPAAAEAAPAPQASAPAKPKTEIATSAKRDPAPAAPSVRRLARELGVDIHDVQGSGLGGRISEDDVKQHTKQLVTAAASGGAVGSGVSAGPLPDFAKWGAIERQPLSGIRTATAQQMSRAWLAPHVTQFDKADITALEATRKQLGKLAEQRGGKLTVTAIALKVVVAALKRYPQFNSSLDLANKQLVLKNYFHIGVAVDTENGLLVPVIRDVDQKNVFELAAELSQISEKARARKIGLEDMQGGCFTITNVGGIGGTAFTPIVNVPEVAILGIARGQMEAKWNGASFDPALMLPLSLSYDHRVIDGADGARFLRLIADLLEQPFLLGFES